METKKVSQGTWDFLVVILKKDNKMQKTASRAVEMFIIGTFKLVKSRLKFNKLTLKLPRHDKILKTKMNKSLLS